MSSNEVSVYAESSKVPKHYPVAKHDGEVQFEEGEWERMGGYVPAR